MDELLIPSAAGSGGLLFSERSPHNRAQMIDSFWVRVTGPRLSAADQVYAGYPPSHPAPLFAEMARQWSGWPGELAWEPHKDFALRCTHDRRGHVAIRVELRSLEGHWQVVATVMTEAGQLQDIARRAEAFFGRAADVTMPL